MNTVTKDFSGLTKFKSQLTELAAGRAQVGLFAANAGRSADEGREDSNPTLGFIHEFGSGRSPERSWLRMPLSLHLAPLIISRGSRWLESLRTQGAKRTLAFLGILAEDVIQEGFATRGYGAWAPNAPATVARKGSSAPLIESAQMRKAVSSRVV